MDDSETKKKKVCAYCRVSTDMEDQRTSYLSQINHYTDYIKKNKDWEFAVIFIVILLLEISFTIDFICRCLPIN